jgi:peptide-methionine (S)-S-oxide reductase
MRLSVFIALGILAGVAAATYAGLRSPQTAQTAPKKEVKGQSIVVAGGCFWCLEPLFEMIKGVEDVEVGYAGGARPNPTYEQVCTGATGHAESIKVTYDPEKISAHDLLTLFLTMHDPTTLNRQGPDSGTQYRSAIFYQTDEEKALAQQVIAEVTKAKIWRNRIVTTIEPLRNYTTAEAYHQDYYRKFDAANPAQKMQMNAGYCSVVIEPKVRKFREHYKHLLKE